MTEGEDPADIFQQYRHISMFPYTAAAAPLISRGRSLGTVTILRDPIPDKEEEAGVVSRLEEVATRLANELSQFSESEMCVGPTPVIVPVSDSAGPCDPTPSRWGIPEVAASVGMTCMYQLRRLSSELNSATGMKDVIAAAHRRISVPFGCRAVILSRFVEGRTWVVGHNGASRDMVRMFHGASIQSRGPLAEAMSGRPLFLENGTTFYAFPPDPALPSGEAEVYLPLLGSNGIAGVCHLGFPDERRFAPEEKSLLIMMANLLGSTLERLQLTEGKLELASSVQRKMLPRSLPDVAGMVSAARYVPASSSSEVGGDWYDVIAASNGRVVLAIGDVEGHGIDSAAVMGQVRSAVSAFASEGHGPSAIIERTSKLFLTFGSDLLATCCIVCVDVANGVLEVASAGHLAPLVRDKDGSIGKLDTPPGIPLGVPCPQSPPKSYEFPLSPGSMLLLYSDGLIQNRQCDTEEFALRLFAECAADGQDNVEDVADRLISGVPDPAQRYDDAALLLVKADTAADRTTFEMARLEIQPRDLRTVSTARKFARNSLRTWQLNEISDDLEITVSEIVTNALIHAGSDVDMRLYRYPDRVRLEVRDSDSAPPIPSSFSMSEEGRSKAENGRGMVIVENISGSWGSSPNGRGKTVWIEFLTPPPEPAG
ncbi:SpoIIE family protein phosphatase [Streptomyces sp. NPDC088732]|uniref:ATP-binding SpoIIE family protein phosphatase n=1 Tax=Streptomyces sp. NPDC088732 TaxID=3365879 RepID=UPI003815A562